MSIAQSVLYKITELRKEPLRNVYELLIKSERWSSQEMMNYQNEKIKELIRHSVTKVPFYRSWLKERNLDLDWSLNGFDLLKMLPIVDKDTYRTQGEMFKAENVQGPYEEAKTSGSTGIALHFPKSLKSAAFQRASLYRGHSWHQVAPGDREARLWGIPVNFSSRIKVHCRDFLLNRFREARYNLDDETMLDFHHRILRKKPVYLMGYTSMVTQYGKYLKRNDIDGREYGLRMIKCTSETIHESDREIVQEVFGKDIVSEYGAAESGLIAFQCERGGLHLAPEGTAVELIPTECQLEDPELREVVVTNLDNFHFPILRYRIGDLASPAPGPCPCGRTLPLLKRVVGRVSDVIKSSNGRAWHSIILYYIIKGLQEKGGGISQFRAEQDKLDSLIITVVPDQLYSKQTEDFLKNKCRQIFGSQFNVEIHIVSSIEREISGKLRDYISHIK